MMATFPPRGLFRFYSGSAQSLNRKRNKTKSQSKKNNETFFLIFSSHVLFLSLSQFPVFPSVYTSLGMKWEWKTKIARNNRQHTREKIDVTQKTRERISNSYWDSIERHRQLKAMDSVSHFPSGYIVSLSRIDQSLHHFSGYALSIDSLIEHSQCPVE